MGQRSPFVVTGIFGVSEKSDTCCPGWELNTACPFIGTMMP